MKFVAATLAAFALSINLVDGFVWQAWSPAGTGDSRAPCPGLNTLANHGYINHNGSDIQQADLVSALMGVYNLDEDLADTLASAAYSDLGRTNANGVEVLNLFDLAQHNVIEHDASLTRNDLGDVGSDNWSVQRTLLDQLKNLSADGQVLTWCSLASARTMRPNQEAVSDPTYGFSVTQSATAYAEASLVLEIFGNSKNVSLDHVESFFWNEEIPTDWVQPATAYGEIAAAEDVTYLKGLTLGFC